MALLSRRMLDVGVVAGLRRERARCGVVRVRAAIERWRATWAPGSGHDSQLALITATLDALLARMAVRADAITAADLTAARAVDADLAVVERAWRAYAERFDQRRSDAGPALRTADELVWSCTVAARGLAASTAAPLRLPLAFAEPAFAPTALPRTEPPPELAAADRALAALLRELPVPLVGVPTSFADEPWWMILLAHEVGHHAQLELEPDDALGDRTCDLMTSAGGPDGARWAGWHREVFADAFAVAAIGPMAIRAIAELEWDTVDAMAAPRAAYPPALIRLALMTELGRALGHAVDPALVPACAAIAEPGLRAQTTAWTACAVAAAAALAAMPIGAGTLRDLAAACQSGTPDERCLRVLAGEDLDLQPSRIRPLRAIAAAFQRYAALADEPDPARRDPARAALRQRLGPTIERIRDVEVRRATTAPPTGVTDALLDRLDGALRTGWPR
jgi:hypothetical protein